MAADEPAADDNVVGDGVGVGVAAGLAVAVRVAEGGSLAVAVTVTVATGGWFAVAVEVGLGTTVGVGLVVGSPGVPATGLGRGSSPLASGSPDVPVIASRSVMSRSASAASRAAGMASPTVGQGVPHEISSRTALRPTIRITSGSVTTPALRACLVGGTTDPRVTPHDGCVETALTRLGAGVIVA